MSAGEKFQLVEHYFDPFIFVFTNITAGVEQGTGGHGSPPSSAVRRHSPGQASPMCASGGSNTGGRRRTRTESDHKSGPVTRNVRPRRAADERQNIRARVARQIHIAAAIEIHGVGHLRAVAPQISKIVDSRRAGFCRIQFQAEGVHGMSSSYRAATRCWWMGVPPIPYSRSHTKRRCCLLSNPSLRPAP